MVVKERDAGIVEDLGPDIELETPLLEVTTIILGILLLVILQNRQSISTWKYGRCISY